MNPRLRKDLELLPLRLKGENYVLVRDPWGLVPEGRLLPFSFLRLVSLMDGTRSLRDLQLRIMEDMGGTLVTLEEVESMVKKLEKEYILEGSAYEQAKQDLIQQYLESPLRRPFNAGKSYPEDPDELRKFLEGLLPERQEPSKRIKALIAPHIDLRVGGRTYGEVYGRLPSSPPQRIVVLGVGHQMDQGLFSISKKDFLTPFGLLKNWKEASEYVSSLNEPVVVSEVFHRSEHSIEFQTLFLRYLYPEEEIQILPVLCGPVSAYLREGTREAYLELCGDFIQRFLEILNQYQDTWIIAGIDLSHIGPKFGDPYPAAVLEPNTREHDKRIISAVSQGDRDSFWESFARSEGRYKVCGFATLALLLEILKDYNAELLGYELWHEAATQSAVSFMGMVCYE